MVSVQELQGVLFKFTLSGAETSEQLFVCPVCFFSNHYKNIGKHMENVWETHRNQNQQANTTNSVRSETCNENNSNEQKQIIQYNLAKV